ALLPFGFAAHARPGVLFRKIHVGGRTPHGGAGGFNHDPFDNRLADAGDELAADVKGLPLFRRLKVDRRSKSFNGAIFIMSSSTGTVAISGEGVLRRFADFFELAKSRIVLMVLVMAFVGFYVGSEKIPDYLRLLQMLFGTALAAGGTLALNQFVERDTDAMMQRTRRRPLPDGRVQPDRKSTRLNSSHVAISYAVF